MARDRARAEGVLESARGWGSHCGSFRLSGSGHAESPRDPQGPRRVGQKPSEDPDGEKEVT